MQKIVASQPSLASQHILATATSLTHPDRLFTILALGRQGCVIPEAHAYKAWGVVTIDRVAIPVGRVFPTPKSSC